MHSRSCSIMTDKDTKFVCGGNGSVDDILHICVIFFVVLYVFSAVLMFLFTIKIDIRGLNHISLQPSYPSPVCCCVWGRFSDQNDRSIVQSAGLNSVQLTHPLAE